MANNPNYSPPSTLCPSACAAINSLGKIGPIRNCAVAVEDIVNLSAVSRDLNRIAASTWPDLAAKCPELPASPPQGLSWEEVRERLKAGPQLTATETSSSLAGARDVCVELKRHNSPVNVAVQIIHLSNFVCLQTALNLPWYSTRGIPDKVGFWNT